MANRPHIAYRHSTNVRSNKGREWAMRHVLKALSFSAPRLTERIVEKLFFTPGSYVPSAEERRRLKEGEPFQTGVHDRRIMADPDVVETGWRTGTMRARPHVQATWNRNIKHPVRGIGRQRHVTR